MVPPGPTGAAATAATGDRDTSRGIFDDLSLHVIRFLESHPAAHSVQLQDKPGVTLPQLQAWHERNYPHVLPDDFKAFLAISDGVTVRWSLRFRGEAVVPFGIMHVNSLELVKPLPAFTAATLSGSDSELSVASIMGSTTAVGAGACARGQVPAAFDLDAECTEGRVALVYWGDRSDCGPGAAALRPQVWFQDLACRWHFIAKSFADYFRLLITHLGVPQWQYAFTDAGLSPAASHWLAFFCPERHAVASECRARGSHGGTWPPPRLAAASAAASAAFATRPRGARQHGTRRPISEGGASVLGGGGGGGGGSGSAAGVTGGVAAGGGAAAAAAARRQRRPPSAGATRRSR